jgi:hypothetical protein
MTGPLWAVRVRGKRQERTDRDEIVVENSLCPFGHYFYGINF